MMRTLTLMRHAQAASYNTLGDKARELTALGCQNAQTAGLELAMTNVQYVLCSSAVRTRQTFHQLGLTSPTGEPVLVEFLDKLYYGSTDDLMRCIGEVDNSITSLLVIGHAPTIPLLAAKLASVSLDSEADTLISHYPTAAFTRFSVPKTWQQLANGDFSGIIFGEVDHPQH